MAWTAEAWHNTRMVGKTLELLLLRTNEIYAMRYLPFQVAEQVNSPEQSDLPICRYRCDSVDQKFKFSDLQKSAKITATLRMQADL